jgi:hypothetical protein
VYWPKTDNPEWPKSELAEKGKVHFGRKVSRPKFSRLTSVHVERSFSLYKQILSNRTNMSIDNTEKYIIVNSYNKI